MSSEGDLCQCFCLSWSCKGKRISSRSFFRHQRQDVELEELVQSERARSAAASATASASYSGTGSSSSGAPAHAASSADAALHDGGMDIDDDNSNPEDSDDGMSSAHACENELEEKSFAASAEAGFDVDQEQTFEIDEESEGGGSEIEEDGGTDEGGNTVDEDDSGIDDDDEEEEDDLSDVEMSSPASQHLPPTSSISAFDAWVSQVVLELFALKRRHSSPDALLSSILEFIHKHFGSFLNHEYRTRLPHTVRQAFGRIKHLLSDSVEIDCCIGQCIAFTGKYAHDERWSLLICL